MFRHTEYPAYQAETTIHQALHCILVKRTPAGTAELLDLRTTLSGPELNEMEQLLNEI
ncbi:hypothetical protein [Streptomyces sp. NPDC002467]|uniref:hypothetical protein n=1 Tax=Streptomyces sp. NPDC002467 TaxID=3364647 RepID=UPI0036866CB4